MFVPYYRACSLSNASPQRGHLRSVLISCLLVCDREGSRHLGLLCTLILQLNNRVCARACAWQCEREVGGEYGVFVVARAMFQGGVCPGACQGCGRWCVRCIEFDVFHLNIPCMCLFNLCWFTVSVELVVALLFGQWFWYAPAPPTFCAYVLALGIDWGMYCVLVYLSLLWLVARCC